jgi:hypothetical protein
MFIAAKGTTASRTSPSEGIIDVSPVFPIPAKGDDRKPEMRILPKELFADIQPSGTGGTPMILFGRPQRHARHRAQGIIGVSPVSPIPATDSDRKPNLSRQMGQVRYLAPPNVQVTRVKPIDSVLTPC